MVALEHHADLSLCEVCPLFALELVHRLFAEPIFTTPLVVEQGQHIQQRRLARARRSHHGEELTRLDVEIDATKYPGLTGWGLVGAFYVLELNGFHKSPIRNEVPSSGLLCWRGAQE